MRTTEPSRRWYWSWLRAYQAQGGFCGEQTLRAVWEHYALPVYRMGGSATVAAWAAKTSGNLYSNLMFEREYSEVVKEELDELLKGRES
ncbi:hypothetical protein CCAX7_60390 [Capsulimonas corticalis]|uniref:Uncharacterized protein n=1 Tax=Capsulimonas corticalis TaxID=2219043 RepID=A0A402CW16_9BACT|nr:hypothetical protein [Capsulimonas corticalis]BDI33988.1 hypothetical protein CCAX7_60390 [Capsulimonas corticalis]